MEYLKKIGTLKIVSYSPSLTLPLTRACVNHCLYCNYRKDGDGILPFSSIKDIVKKAKEERISEILVLSGEKADKIPEVRRDLDSLGMESLIALTRRVCEYLLDENLLPHVNIGTLDARSLEQLKDVSASMGLMIEGVSREVNVRIHPGKDLQERFETIEKAGKLKIPFTTGILLGTGERQEDRFASILAIERIYREYGNIQEIILQRYVANGHSQLVPGRISLSEMEEIILLCKCHMPGVSVQVPPNLEPYWEELVGLDVDDLGGMGSGGDLVNPESPWPEIGVVAAKVAEAGGVLIKRLPIYKCFYRLGWYSERVGKALRHWIEGYDEYKYYSEGSVPGQGPLS